MSGDSDGEQAFFRPFASRKSRDDWTVCRRAFGRMGRQSSSVPRAIGFPSFRDCFAYFTPLVAGSACDDLEESHYHMESNCLAGDGSLSPDRLSHVPVVSRR
jgi:hypothetical protein